MRTLLLIAALAVIALVSALEVSYSAAPPLRFDELIRDDFFAGLGGDQARLDRAMRFAEQALAGNPDHAPALVWHGSGLIYRSAAVFRAGDRAGALDLVDRGLAEMDRAVRLAPDDITVLIPRGATLLRLAETPAFAPRAAGWLDAAVANYRHALALEGARFDRRPEHARGELLGGIAEGLDRLGKTAEARDVLRRIVADVPSSIYSTRAEAWLTTQPAGPRPRLTCVGCHGD
jgi:tetratricopeptide (TPR) repeat protein